MEKKEYVTPEYMTAQDMKRTRKSWILHKKNWRN